VREPRPKTIPVIFPDGRTRNVEASFHTITLEQLAEVDFRHVPKLEPNPIDGMVFRQLIDGGWVALPLTED
jgi:hypothetical protein